MPIKLIDEHMLPIRRIGRSKRDGSAIFELSALLDAPLVKSLETYGYVRISEVELTDGTVICGAYEKSV